MLSSLLKSDVFPYKDCVIHGEEHLDRTVRTALPWSSVPGTACLAMNRVYFQKALDNGNITAIITPGSVADTVEDFEGYADARALVVTPHAEAVFYTVHNSGFHLEQDRDWLVANAIAPSASIHPTAIVGEHVCIGKGGRIGPYAVVCDNTIIGDDTWIGAHVVLGEAGLFPRMVGDSKVHISHFGGVEIGRGCRLQAHATVAASVYCGEYTRIGDDCHLGFAVSVGHDATIAKGCTFSSKALVAGRTAIGENCWIGAGALISNTLEIQSNVSIKIGAVVVEDVEENDSVSGNFAVRHIENLKHMRRLKR